MFPFKDHKQKRRGPDFLDSEVERCFPASSLATAHQQIDLHYIIPKGDEGLQAGAAGI